MFLAGTETQQESGSLCRKEKPAPKAPAAKQAQMAVAPGLGHGQVAQSGFSAVLGYWRCWLHCPVATPTSAAGFLPR